MILPFALWLILIALAPLYFSHVWIRHYGKLSLLFAAGTIGYYLFFLPKAAFHTVLLTGMDYFSFIVLIGSLYVVSGGIVINLKGVQARPWDNVCFLAIGGLLANIFGTTGASMLLIRPWLRMNQSRAAAHHVVFFIFIVANIGGGLTPIGDPPLLLGYLKGVPFWWVLMHCWMPWLLIMGLLLGVFYYFDRRHYTPQNAAPVHESIAFNWWNVLCLAVIIGAVFISHPPLVREILMLAAAAVSYYTTDKKTHETNQFHFAPMIEVAVLFFGVFATMMPALDWLEGNARTALGKSLSPTLVYWTSGGLSGVLDSAPAYLAFASALSGVFNGPGHGGNAGLQPLMHGGSNYLEALSLGTVYFGALTYVGNGPNLMIKAVAEHRNIPVPHFLEYVFKWAVPILVPLLLIVGLIFLR